MSQLDDYRKYSRAAEYEVGKLFAQEKELNEEAMRVEKLKIDVLKRRLHKIADVESADFSQMARAIVKAERRVNELSKAYSMLLAKESQVYSEILEEMIAQESN